MKQPNESPTTTDQIQSCTQYLLDRFDCHARMEQVHEWMDADKLTEALRKHEAGDLMAINLLVEETARMLCRKSAKALVAAYGGNWRAQLERDDFEW